MSLDCEDTDNHDLFLWASGDHPQQNVPYLEMPVPEHLEFVQELGDEAGHDLKTYKWADAMCDVNWVWDVSVLSCRVIVCETAWATTT